MGTRNLVFGLDGADLDVVEALGPEVLPTLHRLMAAGAYSHLRSVQPPATLPNWTTFLTGVNPGKHGVIDFTSRRNGRVHFTAGTIREAPTLVARLDKLGLRCACVGFPATWPPDQLDSGVFISGWDAPVAFEADRSFVWPPSVHDAIVERFGATRFDDVGEFDADQPGWHDALPAKLCERIERKTELARWLLGRGDWDLFAFYFGESDTAGHHLWAHHDPTSPRHPLGADGSGLARVYAALDEALAGLLVHAGDDTELTIVSDHGFGGASDKVLYLNRALAEAGLLRFNPAGIDLTGALKDFALTRLPPKLKEWLFRVGDAALPSWLETRARFANIDFSRTRAFSDELNYFPGVWLNTSRTEPRGIVRDEERTAVAREVSAALHALRDPWTGKPIVDRVWPREEIFEGPHVDRAPDLLLRLHLDDESGSPGHSYNLMPSGQAPGGTGPWRRLAADEHLGRKGRSLPGSHRERGLFVASGPRVAPVGQIDAHIADAAATLLARMDVAAPAELDGRVLWELFTDFAGETRELPGAIVQRGRGDASKVERRLRALGYID